MTEIKLPDFDDMYVLVDEIRTKSMQALAIKAEIDLEESKILRIITTDPEYFVNGRPPSVAFAKPTYLQTGLDGELIKKRTALAKLQAEVEHSKMLLDLDKLVVDVYRTESANKRQSVS